MAEKNPPEGNEKEQEKSPEFVLPTTPFPTAAFSPQAFPPNQANDPQKTDNSQSRGLNGEEKKALQELFEAVGLRVNEDLNTELGDLALKASGRVKVAIAANREMKTQTTQLQQDIQQLTASLSDPGERERLISDLAQKNNTLYSNLIKLALDYQKTLNELKGGDKQEALHSVAEIVKILPKEQEMEEKILNQRIIAVKNEKTYKEQMSQFELQLIQRLNNINDLEEKINELQQALTAAQEQARAKSEGDGAETATINTQELEALQTEKNQLAAKFDEIQRQNQELRAVNELNTKELERLRQADEQLTQKDQQIQELEAEVQQKIRQLESAKSDLERVAELENIIKENNTQIQAKDEQIQELKATNIGSKDALQALEGKLTTSQQQLQMAVQKIEEFNQYPAQLASLTQQKEALETEKQQLNQQKQEIAEKLEQTQKNFSETSGQITQLQEQLVAETKKHEELNTLVKQKEDKIQDLLGEIEIQKNETAKAREELSHAADSSTSIASLNDQLIEKDRIIGELKQDISALEDKVQKMVHGDEYEKVKLEVESLKGQLKAKDDKIAEKGRLLEEERKSLQEGYNTEKNALMQKLNEMANQIKEIDVLKNVLSEKNEEITALQRQMDNYQSIISQNNQLKENFNAATEKIKELLDNREVLFGQISKLKNDMAGDKAVIQRLERRINDLNAQVQGRGIKENIELDMLRKRVDELNSQLREEIVKSSTSEGKYNVLYPQFEDLQKKYEAIRDQTLLKDKELETRLRSVKDEKADLEKQITDLDKQVRQTKQEKTELELKLMKAEDGGKYKELAEKLKNELKEQTEITESLADDVAKEKTDVLVAKKENTRLNEEIVDLKRQIKVLRRDLQLAKQPQPRRP